MANGRIELSRDWPFAVGMLATVLLTLLFTGPELRDLARETGNTAVSWPLSALLDHQFARYQLPAFLIGLLVLMRPQPVGRYFQVALGVFVVLVFLIGLVGAPMREQRDAQRQTQEEAQALAPVAMRDITTMFGMDYTGGPQTNYLIPRSKGDAAVVEGVIRDIASRLGVQVAGTGRDLKDAGYPGVLSPKPMFENPQKARATLESMRDSLAGRREALTALSEEMRAAIAKAGLTSANRSTFEAWRSGKFAVVLAGYDELWSGVDREILESAAMLKDLTHPQGKIEARDTKFYFDNSTDADRYRAHQARLKRISDDVDKSHDAWRKKMAAEFQLQVH